MSEVRHRVVLTAGGVLRLSWPPDAHPTRRADQRVPAGLRPLVWARAGGVLGERGARAGCSFATSTSSRPGSYTGACTPSIAESIASHRHRHDGARRRQRRNGHVQQHQLSAADDQRHGARPCQAPPSRTHDLAVGRDFQRRRRSHVRAHAHDDRRAPTARLSHVLPCSAAWRDRKCWRFASAWIWRSRLVSRRAVRQAHAGRYLARQRDAIEARVGRAPPAAAPAADRPR